MSKYHYPNLFDEIVGTLTFFIKEIFIVFTMISFCFTTFSLIIFFEAAISQSHMDYLRIVHPVLLAACTVALLGYAAFILFRISNRGTKDELKKPIILVHRGI